MLIKQKKTAEQIVYLNYHLKYTDEKYEKLHVYVQRKIVI